jgi:ABC-2 type transport system ATP-binding protein
MAGLVTPSAGTATILGRCSEEPTARRAICYMPEAPRFPGQFTGRELIEFAARLAGLSPAAARRRGAETLELVGLAGAADRNVHGYSKGMQQRLGLAQALVHEPQILILDEPAAGLDPVGLAEFGELILELKAMGRTILLSSHHLEQMQELCDAATILEAGRWRWSGGLGDCCAGELEEIYIQHVAAGAR